jgi:hypothetical protein
MEQLSKQKFLENKLGANTKDNKFLAYANGPFIYKGSSEFANVYQENDKYRFRKIIYSLPDNKTNVLINDIDDKVDMSTFITIEYKPPAFSRGLVIKNRILLKLA